MLDVLIVEDDLILLDFLAQEVANLIHAPEKDIRKALSFKTASKFLSNKLPDWLLIDLLLPDGSGIDLAEEFIKQKPNGTILILTAHADQASLPAHLAMNVHSLINKTEGLLPVREAIWEICSKLDQSLPNLSLLTPRQLEFLRLLGEGADTAQIAKKMNISFSTAQTHRRQITRKLSIKGSALITMARSLPSQKYSTNVKSK